MASNSKGFKDLFDVAVRGHECGVKINGQVQRQTAGHVRVRNGRLQVSQKCIRINSISNITQGGIYGPSQNVSTQINLGVNGVNTLQLQWQVQGDEFVFVNEWVHAMPADMSVLTKLTIDNPAPGVTLLVPLKKATPGKRGQIQCTSKFCGRERKSKSILCRDNLCTHVPVTSFSKGTHRQASYQGFQIEFTQDMFEHLFNQLGNNFGFSGTISLVLFNKDTLGKEDRVTKPAKPTNQRQNDVAATEMLKELHIKLSDPSSADCTIICHGKRLPSHKYILSMRSKVFEAMFSHDSLEEGRTSEVTIDDVSPEVMKKFLDFVIGKDIQFDNSQEAGEMLMAADKYDVQGLFNFCEQEMLTMVNAQNCVEFVIRANLCKAVELKFASIKTLVANKKTIKNSDEWNRMKREHPELAMEVLEKLMAD